MIKAYQQIDLFGKQLIVKAVIEPPFRMAVDMTDEACFYYVTRGCAKVYTPTEQITTQSDEGLVLKCGRYLNEYLADIEAPYCEAIAIHLHPEVLKKIYDQELPSFISHLEEVRPIKYEVQRSNPILTSFINSLNFYFENPTLVSDELMKLKIKELLLILAKTDNLESVVSLLKSLFSRTELDFRDTIEANLYQNLSLQELASLTHQSLSSFKRTFRKYYESSPARYIRQRRLEKAALLLTSTTLKIAAIAYDCGFTDQAHFSKLFLSAYQQTPTAYRHN